MTEEKKKLELLLKPNEVVKEAKDIIGQTSPLPLYIEILKSAEMYNKAYQLLRSKMMTENNLGLFEPMIMNLCFSIELLLKSFIFIEKKNYSELTNNEKKNTFNHKYSVLFGMIEETHRKNILSAFSLRMGLPEINEDIFEKILDAQNCNNPFVKWRYTFELVGINQLNSELLENLNEVLGIQLLGYSKNNI